MRCLNRPRRRPRPRLGRRYVLWGQNHRAKGCSRRRGEDLQPCYPIEDEDEDDEEDDYDVPSGKPLLAPRF
jgi:hypothetical protein